jgi:hypothetical protein
MMEELKLDRHDRTHAETVVQLQHQLQLLPEYIKYNIYIVKYVILRTSKLVNLREPRKYSIRPVQGTPKPKLPADN